MSCVLFLSPKRPVNHKHHHIYYVNLFFVSYFLFQLLISTISRSLYSRTVRTVAQKKTRHMTAMMTNVMQSSGTTKKNRERQSSPKKGGDINFTQ